jgi:xanthine dehydrogenase accessory factor
MHFLGFYIKLYDDRPGLNTIAANSFACEKYIVNYDSIDNYFIDVENEYAVIMTIGYRTDKTVLKQLLEKSFFYLGLLGSQHKIETLFKELKAEGVTEELLNKIFSPIGLNINSKTTKEIAVSIAAEIVREKNKKLPTVRNR